jgi:glycosyltransferase involved in cell wall biosynthesis
VVGYVGVMGRQEGLDLLLEAIAYLRNQLERDDTQFVLVGDGTELPRLRVLARELGVEDCVTFTGRIPDEQLWEVLSTADVCVNPDRANEMNDKSTMNKVLEYMALAKPVVQFDLTEGRYSAGAASLYARPDDSHDFALRICELLDDPARRQAMGAFGRSRVEFQLAWHHQIPRLLAAHALALTAPAPAGLAPRADHGAGQGAEREP